MNRKIRKKMTTTSSRVTTMTSGSRSKSKQSKRAAPKLPAAHYTADYIINPAHPVTVNVIGCGGTGSQVLTGLARMNSALKALGHVGLFVRAIDPDRVTEANMGRQLFSPADVGSYKCTALVGRINRFFGTDWDTVTQVYGPDISPANITISCVDTGNARLSIKKIVLGYANGSLIPHIPKRERWHRGTRLEPFQKPYYWMDYGNTMDRGQVVIGTVAAVNQPTKTEFRTVETLPTVDRYHPEILVDSKDEDTGPSCSLAEALNKQDLFINTNLANLGLGILWQMFRKLHIRYHGCYVNLETFTVNPIKIS